MAHTPKNLPTISSELKQLVELVTEWESNRQIPDIEREIALDKLKVLYAQLKNISTAPVDNFTASHESSMASSSTNLRGVFYEIQDEEPQKAAPAPAVKPQPSSDLEGLVVPDFQPLAGRTKEVEEQPRLTTEEAIPILESISSLAGAINSSAKAAEMKFDFELLPLEEEKPVAEVEHKPAPAVEPQKVEEKHPKADQRLADKFEGQRTFLNEVISTNRQADLASKLQHNHIADLRKAISFNDKFFLIKELFKGDAHAYEDTIAKLNGLESLDQALIYIQENHSWDASSEAANLLVDLLQRKFV